VLLFAQSRSVSTTRAARLPVTRRRSRSAFPQFDPEANEEDPEREHRDEHAEDDARSDQIGASEGVHD
jgi:hypothetical protein